VQGGVVVERIVLAHGVVSVDFFHHFSSFWSNLAIPPG
jgi:hypothetical protein